MAIVLFDSNILIDHVLGMQVATDELGSYDDAVISAISWMEVCCQMSATQRADFNTTLTNAGIVIAHTDAAIMERAADLRGATGKKLPDCIIRATAEVQGRTIITRNPADFGGSNAHNMHVLYDVVQGIAINIKPPLP